ncbi:MAG TPA: xanthine dehydrogenase family protein molybdopterin-binding subunit, partial [Pseudolabrys sp.]|nr:xanthine dehydrogenase family protein molybdopterin-binding subunit [Pseudolabrys sp.]
MSAASRFRFVSSERRVREDRRFVAGKGQFVADVDLPNMKHVALITCPYPAARIKSIDKSAALAMPGVHYVLDGHELAEGSQPLMSGLETPNVPRRPLAVDIARYAGEWVAAVVADTRALAEDAAEVVKIEYERLPFVLDGEEAAQDKILVHEAHGTNVLLDRNFVWGEVDKDFADSPRHLTLRVKWGRSATVPIETFGVLAQWDPWREILDVWASIQMPKYPEQIAGALKLPASNVRVHYDVDVGGSYGVKRGIKHTVLIGYLARRLGFPVRLIEDRLENMRGGDAHGPERLFDIDVAFDDDGIIRSMKMRALDNVGAYAGRSPFQLGKPIGAIVGPYRIKSVQYRAMAVLSNKTTQEAVRAFGQGPTNFAIERMVDEVANVLGLDRLEVRRRNLIRHEEFPYLIPSGTTYDSGDYHTVIDKVMAHTGYEELKAERDRLRAEGQLAGIGISACLEPNGGNSTFEPLLNPKNTTTTWMDSCRISVDLTGAITATMHTTSSGQGHETLLSTVVGETLGLDPDLVRVTRADSLNSLPSNSPVGSRMAVMLGGAAVNAAKKLKAKLIAIGAHVLGIPVEQAAYEDGTVFDGKARERKLTWAQLVLIAHREFHRMPPGMEPGLSVSAIFQVPTGGTLPDANGRVQMYPCHSFEFHMLLMTIDPELGRPQIKRYVVGHDCGVVINPKIVRGMTMGGIAHGIGAALYEEFAYDGEGQMVA